MSLTAGGTVGRYQIQGLLGSGGMGEVYKAVDPLLGRPIALKVLRQELSRDPERLSRFLHEARAASALNHPNILTVHEVGDHDGSRFLVSELVDGETLRQRVARGALTLREILDIAIQTASALSAAHAAGIVHRDIKPDNLMLRPDGYVKVLDFGVATFARRVGSSHDHDATIAPSIDTGDGMVVGTIAYMSPEQARGLPVDGRSDCYSLGVVLYELVTGRAPFAAPTTTDLLVAILEREPAPVRTVAPALPLQLEWIVDKALEKDPNLRYQTIADLRVDLQRLKSALESGKLAASAAAVGGTMADVEIERELTDDSPEVAAVGSISWISAALAVAAIVVAGMAMSYYHLARPGAALPLQLPEGGVALNVPGFEPFSRELEIVDAGIGAIVGDTISASTFLVLALAFAIEVFDKFAVPAAISTAVISLAAGLAAASDQESLLPALTVAAGYALAAAILCTIYRRRGFFAAWLAGFVGFLLPEAMAARSLDDPDLLRTTNTLLTLVVTIAAAGVWGAGRRLLQKPALHPAA